MAKSKVIVYGAGGFAREVAWLLSDLDRDFVGYVVDGAEPGQQVNDKPVFSWDEFCDSHIDALVTVAVGDPVSREKMVKKCVAAGFRFATLVHPSVVVSEYSEIGEGSIVCKGSILTVNIEVGQQVHINLDCTIGHDVEIGDFATLAPGVHVSGNVHIGRSVYVGTGAVVINGVSGDPLVIGHNAVIGAGACVTSDVEPDCLYAGVPAVYKKRYR